MLGKPIVVGKRYRLHITMNAEYRCGGCDRILGDLFLQDQDGDIVTVVEHIVGQFSRCRSCHYERTTPNGIYGLSSGDCVPYTWLERIDTEYYSDNDI